MKCPHCGSEGQISVQAVIKAPGSLAHQFSKKNLRSKDVHLQGVLWETIDFICSSSSCGRVTNGYGNYVSKLKERVDELEKLLAALLPAVEVPPMLEGEWLITQPNGRQYVVHSSAKASIARKCGYTVEEIQRTAESAPGQSNQCKNTGNQA